MRARSPFNSLFIFLFLFYFLFILFSNILTSALLNFTSPYRINIIFILFFVSFSPSQYSPRYLLYFPLLSLPSSLSLHICSLQFSLSRRTERSDVCATQNRLQLSKLNKKISSPKSSPSSFRFAASSFSGRLQGFMKRGWVCV